MNQLRQQLATFWSHQSGSQRILIIALGIAAVFLPGTPMQAIVDFIRGNVRARGVADATTQ